MKFRVFASFFLGLVISLTPMWYRSWIKYRPISVVVASEMIPPYQTLTGELLSVRSMPASEVPPGAIRTKEELQDHALVMLALPGQALTASMLGPEAGYNRFFDDTDPVSHELPLDDAAGLLNVFRPGDVVDVIFTYKSRDPRENGTLKTDRILTGSRIRSIRASRNPVVSLLVEPRDQKLLEVAQDMGSFTIALPPNERERSAGTRSEATRADAGVGR